METEPASETVSFFKKLDDGQVPNQESVSVNFSHALFSLWIFWPMKMGLMGCPAMLVRNYHWTLRNISEECTSHMMIWQYRP